MKNVLFRLFQMYLPLVCLQSILFTKHIETETVQYNARADILEKTGLTNCVTFPVYKPCMLSSKGLIDKTAGIRELLKSFIVLSVNR